MPDKRFAEAVEIELGVFVHSIASARSAAQAQLDVRWPAVVRVTGRRPKHASKFWKASGRRSTRIPHSLKLLEKRGF